MSPDRRQFIMLGSGAAAGVALLGGGLFWATRPSSDHEPSSGSARTASSRSATPSSGSAAKPKPSVDRPRYVPKLDRVHSQASYQAIATKAVAVGIAQVRAKDAVFDAQQIADEIDFFSPDDIHTREERIVFMGEDRGWLVGFCHRYLVDMNYPSEYAEDDGLIGTAELENPRLKVLGRRYPLAQLKGQAPGGRPQGQTAWYRGFGSHDAALVYIPKPDRPVGHLGMADIPKVVQHALDNSSSMYGLEFVLMSQKSFEKMRARLGQTKSRLKLAVFVAGMAVVGLAVWPLLGAGASGVALSALGGTKRIMAKALPLALDLGKNLLLGDQGFELGGGGRSGALALLGIEPPAPSSDSADMVQTFLSAVARTKGGSAQFVEFEAGSSVRCGIVFAPGSKMCINVELLSRGLVRLDLGNRAVLEELPELVDAAMSALEGNYNLAAAWAKDERYVAKVKSLSRTARG